MKTLVLGALCALFIMTGCLAEEPGVADDVADDVTSQQSAVEEAPVPLPGESEEEMRVRILYVACYNSCHQSQYMGCMISHCAENPFGPASGSECAADCAADESMCAEACGALWNHR